MRGFLQLATTRTAWSTAQSVPANRVGAVISPNSTNRAKSETLYDCLGKEIGNPLSVSLKPLFCFTGPQKVKTVISNKSIQRNTW